MTPTDLIFQTIGSLTGGLITDLTTAIIGMFTIAFICMGFDLLKGVFDMKSRDKQDVQDELDDYASYTKKRERAKRFSDTYSAEHDFVGPSPEKSKKYSDGTYF
jgi:hypothetical protein